MLINIYIAFSVIFLLSAFIAVKSRMIYLNAHPEKYAPAYDGHAKFLDSFFSIVSFLIKKILALINLAYRNMLHVWVKIIAKASSASDKVYTKSRNKFVEEVVKDKKAVPHFWNHLKKYKREIDEENEIKKEEESENKS